MAEAFSFPRAIVIKDTIKKEVKKYTVLKKIMITHDQ